MDNLRSFALDYLLEWCRNDRSLVADLSPNKDPSTRLKCMKKIATNYRIARNFRDIGERKRFGKALKALDEMGDSIAAKNVGNKVKELAAKFKSDYGDTAISASSKFLWFRHQSPVVIYDRRAVKSLSELSKLCGRKFNRSEYEEYRKEWRKQFAEREAAIRAACDGLVKVKSFLLHEDIANGHLERVIKKRWFHERVFDKFLWRRGSGGFTSGKGKT
jgi:hypothetical protein